MAGVGVVTTGPADTFRIAHLSDPHLTAGPLAGAAAVALHQALARVLALDPQPDCVVITGDLADHGAAEEYGALRDLVDGFPLPLHLAIGNHDDRDVFLRAFAGSRFLAGGETTHHLARYPDLDLVILDTNDAVTPAGLLGAGRLGPDQLTWLADHLDHSRGRAMLLCLHHPPVRVGIPRLDQIGLVDADQLARVLDRYPPAVRVLAGHVHRPITAAFAGSTVSVAPSTHRQVELTLREDQPTGYVAEPTGFLLHLLDGSSCITHIVTVSHTSAAFGAV